MLKDALSYVIENTVPVGVGVFITALWLSGFFKYLRRRIATSEFNLTGRSWRAAVSLGRSALGFGFAKSVAT